MTVLSPLSLSEFPMFPHWSELRIGAGFDIRLGEHHGGFAVATGEKRRSGGVSEAPSLEPSNGRRQHANQLCEGEQADVALHLRDKELTAQDRTGEREVVTTTRWARAGGGGVAEGSENIEKLGYIEQGRKGDCMRAKRVRAA